MHSILKFILAGEDIKKSYDADKNYWRNIIVKFIRSKYFQESLINTSLQLYISYLNEHSPFTTFHFFITISQNLEFKVKFKTILIHVYNPQLPVILKALYLEATLNFLRFAAKHCLIAQLFGGSYQL